MTNAQNPFGFDAEKMASFFNADEFTKQFSNFKMPEFDASAMMAAQQKNMDALVAANKAAAAGYQDLFKKQIAVFEETMSAAQGQLKDIDVTKLDPKTATAQGELVKAAFEKALANMQALAESAQKANTEAFEIVSVRVKESVAELQDLAGKLKA